MTYAEFRKADEERVNNLPVFFAFSKERFREEMEKRGLTENDTDKIYSLGAGGYYLKSDREIVMKYFADRCKLSMYMADYDFAYEAFYYEMGNHEYHINYYQGDYDVCSCFGNPEWAGEEADGPYYLKQMEYGEETIRAYKDARRQFLKDADEKGWY
jgi:hypothetical protein